MELEDVLWWKNFKENFNGSKMSSDDYSHICLLHSKYFNHNFYKPCTCNGAKTIKQWAKDIDELYNIYK